MDQNWLMAALQSPEGMNFLNSWRQRYGGGGASNNTYGSGSPPASRWRSPMSGGGGTPILGLNVGGGSFSAAGSNQAQDVAPAPTGLLRGSFSIRGGSNDLAGHQQMTPTPMPYWNPGN